jgi:hypothetical protein
VGSVSSVGNNSALLVSKDPVITVHDAEGVVWFEHTGETNLTLEREASAVFTLDDG